MSRDIYSASFEDACARIHILEEKLRRVDSLAASCQLGIFASRDTVQQALDYAQELASASSDGPTVLTATYVALNTICEQLQLITND